MKIEFISHMKMKHKLFVSYLAVILIPLTVLGFYSYQQSKKVQLQQADIVLRDSLMKMQDTLSYKLQRFNAAIELISYNPNFARIFNDEYDNYYEMYEDLTNIVDPLINTMTSLNSDISRITIYTENNLTERVNSIMPIASVAGEPWYAEAMKTLDTHWYVKDGNMFGVRRIFGDIDYEKKNLVYVEMKPGFLSQSFSLTDVKQAEVVITDPAMNIVYDSGSAGGGVAAGPRLIEERKAHPGTEPADFIWLQQPVRESNWTLSLIVPADALTISPWRIIRATAITEGVSIAVLLLLIWMFSRVFVRRIQRLNQKMRQVEEGTLSINMKVLARDEIGELELRFGKMLASINTLIEEGYKSKLVQREAELRALQSQINPHFLYNSLSIINWKAIEKGADDISHVAGLLSTFYRTTLNRGSDKILVRDELLNTKSYLEMQLIMHDHSFDVVYDIADDMLENRMIKLVLQPIVENAIEHGIDQKRTGRGELRIAGGLTEDGHAMVFAVEDNGPGIDKTIIEDVLVKQSKGYGLFNVQERIRVQYGGRYGIAIDSEAGLWTRVRVTLPVRG